MIAADISSIIPEIKNITAEIKNMFGPFSAVGRTILGFGSIFWVSIKMWRIMATGEVDGMANHLESLAKPLFLGLLLIFYSAILSFADFLIAPIGKSTEGWAQSYMQTNQKMEEKYQADLKVILEGSQADGEKAKFTPDANSIVPDAMQSSLNDLSSFFSSIGKWIAMVTSLSYWMGIIVGILNTIVNFALMISYLGLMVMRGINLSILVAFGPIAIGLSVFHAFSDNWKAFFANYVSKLLWFPVANMVLAIAYRLKNISDQNAYDTLLKFAKQTHYIGNLLFSNSPVTDISNSISNVNSMTDWSTVFLSIGVTIIGIFALMQTPSLTSLIISGASGGMTASPVSGNTVVGVGGAAVLLGSKAISGITSGIKNVLPSSNNSGGKQIESKNGQGNISSQINNSGEGRVYGAPNNNSNGNYNKSQSSVQV